MNAFPGLFLTTVTCVIVVVCILRTEGMVSLSTGTALGTLFRSSQAISVWGVCICSLMVGIVMIITSVVEAKYGSNISSAGDRFERGALGVLFLIPSFLMIALIRHRIVPVIFVVSHLMQGLYSHVVVTSFVRKLLPSDFSFEIMTLSNGCVSLSTILLVLGYGSPSSRAIDTLGAVTAIIGFSIFAYSLFSWIWHKNVLGRWWVTSNEVSLDDQQNLTLEESYCLMYSIPYLSVAAIVAVTICVFKGDFSNFNESGALLFIGSYAVFGVIVLTIPTQASEMIFRKQVQQESEEKVRLAQQVSRAKQGALRYLSHELRSPLSAISTSIHCTLDDLRSGEWNVSRLTSALESMQAGCSSSVQILDETLMIEKIEAGLFRINTKMMPAVKTVLRILRPIGIHMIEKMLKFKVVNSVEDEDSSILALNADKLKIEQVLRNLVSNAVKFSPKLATITAVISYEAAALPCFSSPSPAVKGNDNEMPIPQPHTQHMLLPFISGPIRVTPLTVPPPMKTMKPIDPFSVEETPQKGDLCLNDYRSPDPWAPSTHQSGHLVIDVIDSGPGISEDNAKKLFGEFTQFDSDKLQGGGGFGLGLWLSREIMKHHHGSLTYKPRTNGTGSIFTARLPCFKYDDSIGLSQSLHCNSQEEPEGKEDEIRAPDRGSMEICACGSPMVGLGTPFATTAFEGREGATEAGDLPFLPATTTGPVSLCLRILIVDDSELVRKMAKSCIDRHLVAMKKQDPTTPAHIILHADDGVPAVAKVRDALLQGSPIDLVIMDNIMLEMNGPKAAQLMREAGYKGPIVGHTGNVSDEDVAEFVAHGADSVLKKPLDMAELGRLLKKAAKDVGSVSKELLDMTELGSLLDRAVKDAKLNHQTNSLASGVVVDGDAFSATQEGTKRSRVECEDVNVVRGLVKSLIEEDEKDEGDEKGMGAQGTTDTRRFVAWAEEAINITNAKHSFTTNSVTTATANLHTSREGIFHAGECVIPEEVSVKEMSKVLVTDPPHVCPHAVAGEADGPVTLVGDGLVVDSSQGSESVTGQMITAAPATVPAPTPAVVNMSPLRILVADDSEMVRKMVVSAINRHFKKVAQTSVGVPVPTILHADDGVPAVAKVRDALLEGSPIDLVIMDNIMLEMNGPKAAQLMREAGYKGPIVGHTGNVSDEDVAEFVAHGADSVLKKPLDMAELGKILKRAVKAQSS